MTLRETGRQSSRRRRRGPAIMVWLFMFAAVGVFAVFVVQVTGFDLDTITQSGQPAPVTTSKQAPELEKFAVKGSEVSGYDEDQQPYKISAEEAKQDKQQPNLVHLRKVTGLLKRTDGKNMDVSADNGLFNSRNKSLRLFGDVAIRMTDSFVARMDTADVDVRQKALTSDADIVVVLEGGVIRSTGLDVTNNGEHVTFRSQVRAEFESAPENRNPAVTRVQTTSSKGNLQQ